MHALLKGINREENYSYTSLIPTTIWIWLNLSTLSIIAKCSYFQGHLAPTQKYLSGSVS